MNPIDFQSKFGIDEYIFREGDDGDCAYIIDSGMVEISLDKDGHRLVVATLTKGDILGEMAIISREERSASARAIVPTCVTAIPIDYVSKKIEEADPTVSIFLRMAMARCRDMNLRLVEVFEGLSMNQPGGPNIEEFASTTMELKDVALKFSEMHKRIDSAITRQTSRTANSMLENESIQKTKKLINEEKMLQSALANKEFRLHYQPIVDLSSQRVVGCEALVRWQHPSGELVSPVLFIPQAENSGLIVELGYWIAEEACRFQNRLLNDFKHNLFMSINLSGKQFDDHFLVTRLSDIMEKAGVDSKQIKFEVTESLLMENPELAAQSLNKLKETGATLAIDDFGTGYSSFSYLHRFPFDTLKIDRVFVSAMSRSKKSKQIVKSLISMSHELGMNVVAEGIETVGESKMISQYEAKYGQGFYFSKPVNETNLVKLLLRPTPNLGN
jgi:EAL domain-containing protein (putative c-di-GMP-specific phosphodiesterase class I)/CRP-like cAMP-binding protein